MGRIFLSARCFVLIFWIASIGTSSVTAQQAVTNSRHGEAPGYAQGVYLVFPFENAGASPKLEWLGEGLEELTIQRLSAAGEQVYSHAGRVIELERYGLPPLSKFSRATMLHIAEDLDADFVIFGRFSAKGSTLTIESRILKVNPTELFAPLLEAGPLDSLMDLHSRMVWRMLSAGTPHYPLSLEEFTKKQRPLRLDAFEHYIRGLLASDDDAKLRELHEAARLEPDWPDPDFALGEAYYARRDYDSALAWLFKVPKGNGRYAEAAFATGVCRLQLNQADHAEEAFTALQEALRNKFVSGVDLPEILNDLAIARARQGKMDAAEGDLRRAAELDPDEDDYPFNLGLIALKTNDAAAAAEDFREAAEHSPDNPEDRALLIYALEKAGKQPEADEERESAVEAFGPKGVPTVDLRGKDDPVSRLFRIKTELDVTALRAEIETGETAAGGTNAEFQNDTPAAHVRRGRQELAAGHTDDAEKDFRAALAQDRGNAAAHRGLAELSRRQGKLDDAVKELQASLQSRDSAIARTMLAKIYLEQKKPELAQEEAERALKLAPNYTEAKQLLEYLRNSKATDKKPGGGTP